MCPVVVHIIWPRVRGGRRDARAELVMTDEPAVRAGAARPTTMVHAPRLRAMAVQLPSAREQQQATVRGP